MRIATRGSELALWQAHHVQALLLNSGVSDDVEIVIVSTTGDRDKQRWDLPRALKRVGQVAHESADAIVRVLRSGSADGPGNIE